MKGTLEEGMNFLMECLVLNLYMKMECSNFSSNEAAHAATRFMKRETIMDQNISRQTNY
jgi:hypothetical protein